MKIESTHLWPVSYNDVFTELWGGKYSEFMFWGGRGSCKSSFISLAIRILIAQYLDINALVLRKKANTLRDSVFAQLNWAGEMLGLGGKKTVSPMMIKQGEQKILFRGSDDPTSIKSIKVERGYIGILWFEELTEFTPAEVRSILQSVMRGGNRFWVFYSFNPPMNRNNWVNKEKLVDKPGRLVVRSDYTTVPEEWLGPAFLDEANWQKEHNEKLYLNEYLGECTGTGLDVFENIHDTRMTDDQIGKFDYFFHGVDWGYYPDPWAYNGMAYNPSTRELYIFDEMEAYKKGNAETSTMLMEHIKAGPWKWYTTREPKAPAETNVKLAPDSAEPKSIADYRSYGWQVHAPDKTGLRDYSFKWLQSLKAIHIDAARCPRTWAEFSGYSYIMDKNGEIEQTYPEGQADHHIACVRYALEEVYKRRGL